jgi:hypothetical protein
VAGWHRLVTLLLALTTALLPGIDPDLLPLAPSVFGLVLPCVMARVLFSGLREARSQSGRPERGGVRS